MTTHALPARLLARIDVRGADECWPWTGSLTSEGYGKVYDCGHMRSAHRVVYEAVFGPVAPELHVDHLCHKRECMNPAHLEACTALENQRRRKAHGAHNYGRKQRRDPSLEPGNQGSRNGSARLNEEIVREILRHHDGAANTTKCLAEQFGVKPRAIREIIQRKKWKHVEITP